MLRQSSQLAGRIAEIYPFGGYAKNPMMRRLTGIDIACCAHCHQGRLVVIRTLHPLRLPALASETARPP